MFSAPSTAGSLKLQITEGAGFQFQCFVGSLIYSIPNIVYFTTRKYLILGGLGALSIRGGDYMQKTWKQLKRRIKEKKNMK